MQVFSFSVSEFVILKLIIKKSVKNQVIIRICHLPIVTRTSPKDATPSNFVLLPVCGGNTVLYVIN